MNRFKSTVFWSWNDTITKAGIHRRVAEMAKQGIGGFFIHSRAGLRIGYFSEQFFECVEYAIEEAVRYGLDVWFYDEDGWPSGFAGGRVPRRGREYQAKRLVFASKKPDDPQDLIAAFSREGGSWKRVRSGGELFACRICDEHYSDLLNPETTRVFIEETHEEYRRQFSRYFGNPVQGIFTDEPQLKTDLPWSDCLEDEFVKEYGVFLTDNLYLLAGSSAEQPNLFRYRYFKLIEKLYARNYVGQISAWCKRNGLLFTGHFPCEDGLCHQYEIAGDVMGNYAAMSQPAIDHLGRRLTSVLLTSQLRSVKNQLDLPNVLSETFGCSGWNVSWGQLAWVWGYQAAQGVNLPCLHLSAYSMRGRRKRDYPSFFSEQQPWFESFRAFNRWAEWLNALDSQGHACADVLVLHPIRSIAFYPLFSEGQRCISSRYRLLLENLRECQIDFDIGSDAVMETYGRIQNGRFIIGKRGYTTVVIPPVFSLEEHTLCLLEEYVRCGGLVLFTDQPPNSLEGVESERVQAFVARAKKNPLCMTVNNRADLWRKYFEGTGYRRKASVVTRTDPALVGGCALNIRENDGWVQCHVMNMSRSDTRCLSIRFYGCGTIAEERIDGEKILDYSVGKDATFADFVLKPMQSRVFRFYENTFEVKENELSVLRQTISLAAEKISVLSENALTIDAAELAIDGKPYGRCAMEDINELIYDEAERKGGTVQFTAEYSFEVKKGAAVRQIAAETDGLDCICLNGKNISAARNGRFFDESVACYDVADHILEGRNIVTLSGKAQGQKKSFDLNKVHESEKNRFFYPLELESIYVLGDFDVKFEDAMRIEQGYMSVPRSSKCRLEAPSSKRSGDLTLQGMPYYRGEVSFSCSYFWNGEGRVFLCGDWDAPACRIFVNGNEQEQYLFTGAEPEIRLEPMCRNEIEVRLYSSNRNLLGPHHHYTGEPSFVGVSVFKGERGYEDYMMTPNPPEKTRTEENAFVPFGFRSLTLKVYREESDEKQLAE